MFLVSLSETKLHDIAASVDPTLQALLTQRFQELTHSDSDLTDLAHFVVTEPRDTLEAIEREIGFSPVTNLVDGICFGDPDFVPSWEWSEDHGGWFELVFIFTDDGFAHVIFVPNDEGVNADLLQMCREHCRRSDDQ